MYIHDFVRDAIFDIFMRTRVSLKKETHVNFDSQDRRSTLKPTNVMMYGCIGEKHVCVDLIGVSLVFFFFYKMGFH